MLQAVDLTQMTSSPHVTKREMDSGRKSGCYNAILSGKNDRHLWTVTTVKQFASSFLTSTGGDFAFTARMRKVSTGPSTH